MGLSQFFLSCGGKCQGAYATVETQYVIIADDVEEGAEHALWAIRSAGLKSDLLFGVSSTT